MFVIAALWNAVEDGFARGKADAWAGRSKCPPEEDVEAASLYDLGYSEGAIRRSPLSKAIPPNTTPQPQPDCD
ncbi:hypothetical protein [Altericista sp. CCNU0014]|uniref:hypothetical protein n=1 Tax=Altericista sp. CCNU0014 TaxID=3082949 RepID=UPI00384DD672